jgi:hypothetical protein
MRYWKMSENSNSLEAIKLISDWAKWLITIETASSAIIGAYFAKGHAPKNYSTEMFATLAIGSFLVSIAAAAILLLTLPEITQDLQPNQNIWLTRDSVVGKVLHMNTQSLALIESYFFGIGLILATLMIMKTIWS